MRAWITRCLDWLRQSAHDRELAEELRFHQQQLEREALEDGALPDAARAQARRRFGNPTRIVEDTRDTWSFAWLEHLRQDVRFAWRGLRRTPAFTVTVVLTLSLGIGANAVMFGVVDRLMFKPLAYLRDPGSVHRLYQQTVDRGTVSTTVWTQFERYRDYQALTTSFSQFAAVNERLMAVGSGDALREVRIAGVTASYFEFFDAAPALGRFFLPAEDVAPTGSPVAVLAHSWWVSEYGQRDVRGETVTVGNLAATVVGVAPRGFTGLDDAQPAQIFIPLTAVGPATGGQAATRFSQGYDFFWGHVIVRRKPGVSSERATRDATDAFRASWQKAAAQAPPGAPPVRPLGEAQPRAVVSALRVGGGPAPGLDARTSLWVSGVAVLLLVITVANVANLLLSRTLECRHETTVRLALGVSRGRLMAHLLTESAVLAVAGAVGALAVTYWTCTAVFGLLAGTTGPVADTFGARAIVMTLGLTAVVAMATGLVPAWVASRASVTPAVRTGTREIGGGRRLRVGLLVTQAALSLLLVVGALLFVRSLAAVRAMPLGYEPDRILMVNRVLRGAPMARDAQIALRRALMDAARAHPAVEAVTWRTSTPLGTNLAPRFSVDGVESVAALGLFTAQETTGDYFRVMGTRVLRGRALNDADHAGAPRVTVVSEGMARVLWPGQDALGKCLRIGPPSAECTAVVGVVEDIVQTRLTDPERFQFYLPLEQTSPAGGSGMFVRMRGEAAAEAESLRRRLQPLMPGTSYVQVQPMNTLLVRPQQSWRLGATMFSAFGVLALLVASIGLYGVISYSMAQRRREVGVRVALGATRGDIIWMVTRQGLVVALAGVCVGSAIALVLSGWLQPLLFSQSARDPRVYGLAVGVFLVVAAVASLVPAVRAARANPTDALRGE